MKIFLSIFNGVCWAIGMRIIGLDISQWQWWVALLFWFVSLVLMSEIIENK